MEADEFDPWIAVVGPRLHRTARLLTGDWALGEDLVQHACAVTWQRWRSIESGGSAEAFARTALVRASTAWWRRRWRGEVPHAVLPDKPLRDQWSDVDRRSLLDAGLRALPVRQRAVLVLRFYEDLSEAETARTLGWPLGTVKSTTVRALSALRDWDKFDEELRR